MLIRRAADLKSSETTPESRYLDRREFLAAAGAISVSAAFGGVAAGRGAQEQEPQATGKPYGLQKDDKPTRWDDVTGHNNFYEFGSGKEDPKENAQEFRTRPWTVKVDGLVAKPAQYHLEDFIKPSALEDRIYRHRCVEAWSMVVPWRGFPLADVLKRADPTSKAKYVEGLRLDEAMHPLTMMVVGVYGRTLPNQNGAPLRLVVPWKYGFKGIKSIVRIELTDSQPKNTWNVTNPQEYGFYSNVNPEVDHPRWSQGSERRIGEFARRRTLMFNGYADQVASLYAGMDLRKNY